MGCLVTSSNRLVFNMADKSCRSAVVLLCGIPACGKSTLARKIQQHIQKTRGDSMHVIHVCYDDFIPPDLDFNESSGTSKPGNKNDYEEITHENSVEKGDPLSLNGGNNFSKYSLWKQYRRRILDAVDAVLNMIENKDKGGGFHTHGSAGLDELEPEGFPSFREFWNTFLTLLSKDERNCSCFSSFDRWSKGTHVLLVDDNMHYHSMRYEYVQLARKYGSGFAEVFLECPLETALKRNSLRSCPVSLNTIQTMFTKMEPPEPEKFPWEQNFLVLKADEEQDVETMESLVQLFSEALKHPVIQVPEENTEEKEESRLACITSIAHQADQVLRKYLTKVIAEAKGSGKGKKELQSLASKLNKEKKVFLESLHNIKTHHPECRNKLKRTVLPDGNCVADDTESKPDKEFEAVTLPIDVSSETTSQLLLRYATAKQGQIASVERNDGSDLQLNSLESRLCLRSTRMHLCLLCFPNVQDKEKFRDFVEELFKNAINSN